MGTAICAAIEEADGLVLGPALGSSDDRSQLLAGGAEVVVDVTNRAAAIENLPWLASHGIHAVVGTTGFDDEDVAGFDRAFTEAERSCFLVPNFSIGAVLMMRFAAEAAPYFAGVEIIELHHERKTDAPSGTAQLTADRLASARSEPWAPDPTTHETVAGARGGEAAPGIRVHSVRLPGLLAHQEVLFGATGQTLTIRHDSYDRAAFMPGVVRAVRAVSELQPGVTVGLDAVL